MNQPNHDTDGGLIEAAVTIFTNAGIVHAVDEETYELRTYGRLCLLHNMDSEPQVNPIAPGARNILTVGMGAPHDFTRRATFDPAAFFRRDGGHVVSSQGRVAVLMTEDSTMARGTKVAPEHMLRKLGLTVFGRRYRREEVSPEVSETMFAASMEPTDP